MMTEKYIIDSLDKAIAVMMSLVGDEHIERSSAEVAQICGITKDNAFRILKTFEARGWVEVANGADGTNGSKWRLGVSFTGIAFAYMEASSKRMKSLKGEIEKHIQIPELNKIRRNG